LPPLPAITGAAISPAANNPIKKTRILPPWKSWTFLA
jgi:hypothetical protein